MSRHLISAVPAALTTLAAEDLAPDRADSASHTFIGLGLIATAILVLWLLRSSRT